MLTIENSYNQKCSLDSPASSAHQSFSNMLESYILILILKGTLLMSVKLHLSCTIVEIMMMKSSKMKKIVVSVDTDSIHTEQATTNSDTLSLGQPVSW